MEVLSLNKELFFKIFGLSGQSQILDNLMIFGANYLIFLMIILNLFLLLSPSMKSKKVFLFMLLSFFVGFILLKITSLFITEPRPFLTYHLTPKIAGLATDDSFPSDHTLVLSIATFTHLYYRTRYTFVMLPTLAWMGFARVFTGLHYPLDILGGFFLGALAVILSLYIKNIGQKFLA